MNIRIAHTPSQHNSDKWHTMEEHSSSVASLSSEYAKEFGMPSSGYLLGIVHDLGKHDPKFQSYLIDSFNWIEGQDKPKSVPHKHTGALFVSNIESRVNFALSLPILGHHNQIPAKKNIDDELDKTNDSILNFCINDAKYLNYNDEEVIDELNNLIDQYKKDPFVIETKIRLLHSSLVDADSQDTSNHFSPDFKYHANSTDINTLLQTFSSNHNALLNENTDLNKLRKEVYLDCIKAAIDIPGFYMLPGPTGIGKTRSYLGWALNHAVHNDKKRIISILPFTSIIDQTSSEYQKIFNKFPKAVLEHHSAVMDNSSKIATPFFRKRAAENWDAPIVITTTVQFFESLFGNTPSSSRKLHNIVNSVIILDEVQNLPINLLKPILSILKTLVDHCGCSVLFCTATPPDYINKSWGLSEIKTIINNVDEVFNKTKRVTYNYESEPYDVLSLAEELSNHNQALCIVNKRKTAQELINLLQDRVDSNNLYHMSTLMCPKHRSEILAEIHIKVKNNQPVILIATSCIECGVDLDFPIAYREIAPLASIIQAAGRCNRNGLRPVEQSIVTVFEIEGAKYNDGIFNYGINKTKYLLANNIEEIEKIDIIGKYYSDMFEDNISVLDKYNIQESRKYFDYPDVANKFKMIESNTISIIVNYDSDCSNILIDIKNGIISGKEIFRKLSPYTVNVYERDIDMNNIDDKTYDGISLYIGYYNRIIGLPLQSSPLDLVI